MISAVNHTVFRHELPLEEIPLPPLDHEPIEESFGVLKPIKPYRWQDKRD